VAVCRAELLNKTMNHVYRLKRSGRTQQLQPVPETARAAGKGTRTGKTLAQAVTATLASVALGGMASLAHAQQAPPAVNQRPQGGVVTRGNANIVTNTSQAQLTVNQSSPRAVIDWASFNVGSQAKVQFNQPSSSAVTLNNILGNNASQIYGQISANGQVFLSNPNGVYFSPTAQVNVGGLVATTGKANAASSWRAKPASTGAAAQAAWSTKANSRPQQAATSRCWPPKCATKALSLPKRAR
jgi:filamentous hemagglutinin family protein